VHRNLSVLLSIRADTRCSAGDTHLCVQRGSRVQSSRLTTTNTLQHTALHCNTLHYTATHTHPSVCTTRVSGAMLYHNDSVMRVTPLVCILHYNHDHTLQHTATHCNTLQHARTRLAGSPTYHDQHDSLASLGVFPRGFLCDAVRCSMFQCVAVCCSVCCFVLLT